MRSTAKARSSCNNRLLSLVALPRHWYVWCRCCCKWLDLGQGLWMPLRDAATARLAAPFSLRRGSRR